MTDLSSIFSGAPAAAPQVQPQPAPAPVPAVQPAAAAPYVPPAAVTQAPAPAPGQAPAWAQALGMATASDVQARVPFLDAPGTIVGEITDCGHVQKQDGTDAFKIEVRVVESATPALPVGSEWCLFREIPGKVYNGVALGAQDVRTWIEVLLGGAAAAAGREAPPYSPDLFVAIGSRQITVTGHRLKIKSFMSSTKKITKYDIEYVPQGVTVGLGA